MSGGPSKEEIKKYTAEIIQNKPLFNRNLYDAQDAMPWLDPVTYEDARHLVRGGRLTHDNVEGLFRS